MKKVQTAHELYCEILKSFYFGIYRKDDLFMTYQETHERYGLAKATIGRAYGMLQHDGFIRTDGANGTFVTFDLSNPTHVAKVPIERPRAVPEDTIPYEVAMRLHAHALYTGLVHSGEVQLQMCRGIIEDILQRSKGGHPYYEQVFKFWMCTISSLDNEFLSHIADHFISQYLYLLPPSHLSSTQQHLIGASAQTYYEFLLKAIDLREFEEFPAQFEQHYHNYYLYEGIVFSKLEHVGIFKEQVLYRRLLDDFCIKIMSGELQKGDALPTTRRLCAEYHISTTTVNRTYGILTEMGLISRRVRSGTQLIVGPDDPELRNALETFSGFNQRSWRDAVEALILMNRALNMRIHIASYVVHQMKEELFRQRHLFDCYATPYFVSVALFNPVITCLPTGILHKYHAQLTDILNRIITLCTFLVHESREYGDEIYQLMCDALKALEQDNQSLFIDLSECALRRNVYLLSQMINNLDQEELYFDKHENR